MVCRICRKYVRAREKVKVTLGLAQVLNLTIRRRRDYPPEADLLYISAFGTLTNNSLKKHKEGR